MGELGASLLFPGLAEVARAGVWQQLPRVDGAGELAALPSLVSWPTR